MPVFASSLVPRVRVRARHALTSTLLACAALPGTGWAQGMEPFLGQLMLVPYTFCPRGWIEASGQVLPISPNSALFALLGTTFGGNGQTTFALPDLRGRVPVGLGTGFGLATVDLGEVGGETSVTLLTSQLPLHNHALRASTQPATHAAPSGRALAATQNAGAYVGQPTNAVLSSDSVGATGGNQPVNIRNPYLGMRWCIALEGIFPSRP